MELDASKTERQQLAYSTQFFDFTPDAFIDSVTGPSLDTVDSHLDAAKARCASEFLGKVDEQELEESFALIKDAYATNINEVYEKFGRYLKKNIFQIPPDVVLPEDRPHLNQDVAKGYNGQSLQNDLKEFEDMRQRVTHAKYQKAVLQEKMANLEMVAERQAKLLKHAEQFKAENCEINTMVDQQFDILRNKTNAMKPMLEKIENNLPATQVQKHKLDMVDSILSKKQRLNKENHN